MNKTAFFAKLFCILLLFALTFTDLCFTASAVSEDYSKPGVSNKNTLSSADILSLAINEVLSDAEADYLELYGEYKIEYGSYVPSALVTIVREDDGFTVKCSPCREIIFHSNYAWSKRIFTGDALTEAHYKPREKECYIRAEVVDADGKRAWSNIIPIE